MVVTQFEFDGFQDGSGFMFRKTMILEAAATAAALPRAGTRRPQRVRNTQDNHCARTRVEQAMSRTIFRTAAPIPAVSAMLLLLQLAGCSVLPPPSPSADSGPAAQAGAALPPGTGAPPPADLPAATTVPVPAAAPEPAPVTATAAPVQRVKPGPAGSAAPKPAAPATQNGAAVKSDPRGAKVPARPVVTAPAPAAKPPAAAPAPLALSTLEQRLKDTPAIGVFTKITLKNQVDDLLERFRSHYEGRGGTTLAQLRQNYDDLLQKVIGLLREGDPALATAITASREAIWNVLTDPAKFAKL
jgi:hypothetical protein